MAFNLIKIVKEKLKKISKKNSVKKPLNEKIQKTSPSGTKKSAGDKTYTGTHNSNNKNYQKRQTKNNQDKKKYDKNRPSHKEYSKEDKRLSTKHERPHRHESVKKERQAGQAIPVEVKKEEPIWNPEEFNVPVTEEKTRFHDLNLKNELLHAIFDLGFQYCTPIQEAILKSTLEGKDATGRAQTGTGKTAAFLITIINNFLKNTVRSSQRHGAPRALIIAPTRELVMQIASDARALIKHTSLNVAEVYGGMEFNKQLRRMKSGTIDILVATPGRLLDFQKRHVVFLGSVKILVLDEADRMLDMGFIPDVKKIIYSTPPKSKRQTLFFSATLSGDVKRLAAQWTRDAVNVEIDPENVAVESVKQIVYIVTNDQKFSLLYNIIDMELLDIVMVFANRKDEAHPLFELLSKSGISTEVLSGDVDQKKRIQTLNDFKEGKIKVLVATDVASRGIHVDDISHVINYTLPQDPEDYVHRIGRTGRAGATGISISFASEDDSFNIPAIENYIGKKFDCVYPEDKLLAEPVLNNGNEQNSVE